jgi:(5-formylfuran-3-yl)methyl phosphate transaminase
MSDINPDAEQMTPFIVMEVLERASELEKQGVSVIHLEVGEPDFDVPSSVAQAVALAQQNGQTHYTHSLGALDLREAICRFYRKEYGVSVTPDRVLVTSGSSPAILMTLMAICHAGDEVIMTNPGYPCYRNFALACRAVPIEVEVRAETGFQYEPELLQKAITPRTRTLFFNSPMNPSGTLADESLFTALAHLPFPVISDEIYHGLVYKGRARSILEFTDNAFVVNGFSKRFAMTGLRLGYLIAPAEYMRTLQILQQNLFICAPSTAQAAGIAALEQAEADVVRMKTIYNERRLFMLSRLHEIGFEIKVEPQGAFYVLADARQFTTDSYRFAFDVLENAHVGITPGVDFGTKGEGFVRFSYANSLDNIAEGLNRLEKYLSLSQSLHRRGV